MGWNVKCQSLQCNYQTSKFWISVPRVPKQPDASEYNNGGFAFNSRLLFILISLNIQDFSEFLIQKNNTRMFKNETHINIKLNIFIVVCYYLTQMLMFFYKCVGTYNRIYKNLLSFICKQRNMLTTNYLQSVYVFLLQLSTVPTYSWRGCDKSNNNFW